jgi:hypothetical protein
VKLIYAGLAVFMALGALAVTVEVPRPLAPLMGLAMLAALLLAGCGVVGYFRAFFRGEVDKLKQR